MTNLPDQSDSDMTYENELFINAISVSMETFRKLKFCPICGKGFGPTIAIIKDKEVWFILICGDHFAAKSTEKP